MDQTTTLAKAFIELEINEYLTQEYQSKNHTIVDAFDIKELAENLFYKYKITIENLINKYHLLSIESLKARFNKMDELTVDIIESLRILV